MTKDKPEPIISASGNKLSRDPVLARAGKLAERQEFYRDREITQEQVDYFLKEYDPYYDCLGDVLNIYPCPLGQFCQGYGDREYEEIIESYSIIQFIKLRIKTRLIYKRNKILKALVNRWLRR